MPFIVYDQRLYLLNAGRNLLGSGDDADLQLADLSSGCRVGISVERSGSFAWRSSDDGKVTINGHPIDKDPVPLFDGDQLTVHGGQSSSTLFFIDDSAKHIVRGEEPAQFRPVVPSAPTDEPQPRQGVPLITWILLLALAELMAVLFLS